jgi:cytochrome P450
MTEAHTMTDPRHTIPAHVPPELIVHFDFRHDPQFHTDPWALINSMNDKPDIFFSPELGGYWVVTRADLMAEVIRRYDLFSSKCIAIPKIPQAPVLIPNNLDPPVHGKYRRILVQQMFSPHALKSLERDSRRMTLDLIAAVAAVGECEFVEAFARPLPVGSFLKMMGLPPDRRREFASWAHAVSRGETPDEQAAGFSAVQQFLSAWLDQQIANPDAAMGSHMLGALLNAEIDGRRLTKEEMLSIAITLFLGGLDTVTTVMTHSMEFLACNPAHAQLLIDDRSLIPDAVEELLRRFGVASIGRIAAGDFTFHNVRFKEGDLVLYSTAMAGLDRRAFAEPEIVDFRRQNIKEHLAFGTGPHTCPGAHLARVEIRVMLEEVLTRLRNLRIRPGSEIEYVSGGTLAIKALPLMWDAATAPR